jgi:diguanylate cyclase (GGDEF)-like protein
VPHREPSTAADLVEDLCEAMADGVVVVDAAGVVRFANAAAGTLLGRPAAALRGAPFGFPVEDRRTIDVADADARAASRSGDAVQPVRAVEMRVAPVAWAGAPARLVNLRDVTDAVARYDRARAAALHDPLTSLPNRTWMDEHLEQALRVARREGSVVALLFIDLDDFKEVNDRLGHAVGDALLRSVAGRLSAVVRSGDGVARLSGDEFAIAVAAVGGRADAELVARKVFEALAPEHEVEGQRLRVRASIGVALFPIDAASATELLILADTAMYRAKTHGKGKMVFFEA